MSNPASFNPTTNPVLPNPPPLPPLPAQPLQLRRQYTSDKYYATSTTATLITAAGGDLQQLTPAQANLAYQIIHQKFRSNT